MRTEFKLTGLSKPNSFTCEPLDNQNIFWVTNSVLSPEKFQHLFDYTKNNWSNPKTVIIEHEGLESSGIPKNPKIIEILEDNEK